MRRRRFKSAASSRSQLAAAIALALLPLAAIWQGLWVASHKEAFTPFLLKFQIERIECPFCDGTGVIRSKQDPSIVEMCPVCFGVGGHQVRKLDKEKEVLCPACAGMGWIYDEDIQSARPCRRCAGRGLVKRDSTFGVERKEGLE